METAVLTDNDIFVAEPEQDAVEIWKFRYDVLSRVSFVYICWLCVASLIAYMVYRAEWSSWRNYIICSLLLYYFVLVVHVIKRFRDGGTANLLAPDIAFISIYTVFHTAYLVLWSFGLAEYSDWIFFSRSSIPASMLIINVGLIGFIFGYEFFSLRNAPVDILLKVQIPTGGWASAGIALMCIGLMMHLVTLFSVGLSVFRQYGYTAVARLAEFAGGAWAMIWARSMQVFLLGLVIYIVYSSLRFRKLFHAKAVLYMVIFIVSLLIFEGDRGPVFLILLSLMVSRHYFIKPYKVRTLVIFGTAVLVLFAAMKIVRGYAFSPGKMYSELQYAREEGQFQWATGPLAEAGGIYRNANMTSMLVPSQQSYWYGLSWIDAVVHVVPFLQGYLNRLGFLRPAPAVWLTTEILGPGQAGLGFSLPTEGYLNFGFAGAFMEMMFFGLLIKRTMIWFAKKPSAFSAFVFLGILAPTIKIIRDHVSLVTPVYFLVLVLGLMLNMFYGSENEEDPQELTIMPRR